LKLPDAHVHRRKMAYGYHHPEKGSAFWMYILGRVKCVLDMGMQKYTHNLPDEVIHNT